jgi:hypothetical protein
MNRRVVEAPQKILLLVTSLVFHLRVQCGTTQVENTLIYILAHSQCQRLCSKILQYLYYCTLENCLLFLGCDTT